MDFGAESAPSPHVGHDDAPSPHEGRSPYTPLTTLAIGDAEDVVGDLKVCEDNKVSREAVMCDIGGRAVGDWSCSVVEKCC
eukprot:9905884-Heterocapsa_arctica.AAC.1